MNRIAGSALALVIAISGCGRAGTSSSPAADTAAEVQSEQTAEAGAEQAKPCPNPEIRATYLPWLGEGQPVSQPREAISEGDSQLIWFPEGKPAWDGAHVVLRTETAQPPGPTDEPIAAPYPGSPTYAEAAAYLAEGEGARGDNVADVGIFWVGQGQDCNFTVLTFFAPNLSLQEGKAEIVKVAKSLERA